MTEQARRPGLAPGGAYPPGMSSTGRQRFPTSVYSVGSEPDPRFSLANERTFLSWMRTSLALFAGGVALESLGLHLQPDLRRAASVVLLIAGLISVVQAWVGWTGSERRLRTGEPLPSSPWSLPLVAVVLVAGVLVLLAVVTS